MLRLPGQVPRLPALCNVLACYKVNSSYTQFTSHNTTGGWKTCCVGVFWKNEVTTKQRGQWKKSSQFATYHYWLVDLSCRCFGFAWIWKTDLEASKEIYTCIEKKKGKKLIFSELRIASHNTKFRYICRPEYNRQHIQALCIIANCTHFCEFSSVVSF